MRKKIWESVIFKDIDLNENHKKILEMFVNKENIKKVNKCYLMQHIKRIFINVPNQTIWKKLITRYINSPVKRKITNDLKTYLFFYDIYGKKMYETYVENSSKAQLKSYRETGRKARYEHFFKEYWIKKGYTEEEAIDIVNKRKKKALKKSKEAVKGLNDYLPTQINYWIKKGYSVEESRKLVTKRQTTFSREICIEKYGEEKGLEIWKKRQEKWQNTLKSKSPEEIRQINLKKIPKKRPKYTISSVEKYLQNILDCEKQFFLENGFTYYFYDLKKGNKIIEYNGDYWHCNPEKYDVDYFNEKLNMTAKEKWDLDQQKIDFAKKEGYDVLVIWEKDYNENKQKVIQQCKEFFNVG